MEQHVFVFTTKEMLIVFFFFGLGLYTFFCGCIWILLKILRGVTKIWNWIAEKIRFLIIFKALPKKNKATQEKIFLILHDFAVNIEMGNEKDLKKFWKAWKSASSNGFRLHYEIENPALTYQHYLSDPSPI